VPPDGLQREEKRRDEMKPTIPYVAPFVCEYYKENGAGGSLHIVLDDGNVEDSSVQFCIDYAKKNGDEVGVKLGEILLTMSKTQRDKLSRMRKDFRPI
jgi:hypothetical protein